MKIPLEKYIEVSTESLFLRSVKLALVHDKNLKIFFVVRSSAVETLLLLVILMKTSRLRSR